MPNQCASCDHPQVREINHRIREGRPLTDISRWLEGIGTPITRQALSRHAKGHIGVPPVHGRRPVSTDFLQAVVDDAAQQLASGELKASLRDGIGAQKAIDARAARNADRDLMLRIAIALTGGGGVPQLPPPDPEREAIEGEFRELLTAGAE